MSEHDSEDESDVLEESPCGRWLKRREEVEQHDVPGIDATYLAMDSEEGVEVVWNEIRFNEKKLFYAKEKKVSQVFDRLIQLEHPNIVKLHKYWIDKNLEHPRLVFITEYMSSGSLKQFLKRTRRNVIKMALQSWSRWCSQILSAIYYLHTQDPPMVHGNLDCDRIFMSHNGLIKIGWVGGITGNDVLRQFKTIRDINTNIHYVPPELLPNFMSAKTKSDVSSSQDNVGELESLEITDSATSETPTQVGVENSSKDGSKVTFDIHPANNDDAKKQNLSIEPFLTTASDLYSFGICALEMAALEIGNCRNGIQTNQTISNTSVINSNCNQMLSHSNSLNNCNLNGNSILSNCGDQADTCLITNETIQETIDSLENDLQKDFIRQCLQQDPTKRPTAHDLIFHKIIFKVPSLRLIAAHKIVNTTPYQPEQFTEDALFRSTSKRNKDTILAEVINADGTIGKVMTQGDTQRRELDKFLEEVRIGVYPLINLIFANNHTSSSLKTTSTEDSNLTTARNLTTIIDTNPSAANTDIPLYDKEARRIVEIVCNIKPRQKNTQIIDLTLFLRMDDKMSRQVSCVVSLEESAQDISLDLVINGLINEDDREMVARLIEDTINRGLLPDSSLSISLSVSQSQDNILLKK